VDAGEVANREDFELALANAREHRDDMVLWLALHVLLTDDVAMADAVLADRLCVLEDRIENMTRARYGLPDRDARHPAGDGTQA